ncbi:MAG: hypothetical protein RJA70_3121, partial [Pseudomonadota bacterium]
SGEVQVAGIADGPLPASTGMMITVQGILP